MAAARHNRPTIIIYGGTIQPGTRHLDCSPMGYEKGGAVDIVDAFESYGCHLLSHRVNSELMCCRYDRRLRRRKDH
jgi:hypothetical protein